ncbi:hypothetical protein ACLOJK_000117 [Asimina triloba]
MPNKILSSIGWKLYGWQRFFKTDARGRCERWLRRGVTDGRTGALSQYDHGCDGADRREEAGREGGIRIRARDGRSASHGLPLVTSSLSDDSLRPLRRRSPPSPTTTPYP